MLGYAEVGHIPHDVQVGHHGVKLELVGTERSDSCKIGKDFLNLLSDRTDKAMVVLVVDFLEDVGEPIHVHG